LLRQCRNANYLSQEQGFDLDVDNLYVKQAVANEGPRMKRIRPAPMGRAFRYQRRLAHIIVTVGGAQVWCECGDGCDGDFDFMRRRQERRRRPRRSPQQRRRRPSQQQRRLRRRKPQRSKRILEVVSARAANKAGGHGVKGSYGTESPSVWVSPRHQQAVEVALVCRTRL